MNGQSYTTADFADGLDDNVSQTDYSHKSNALSNKLTSVLSTSFADGEIREVLRTLDERHIQNTAGTRRRLRQDAQREVIECNGDIIKDFGQVAEVDAPCRCPCGRC